MDEYDRPARLDALLSGSAAEHLSAPTSFSLRRQSQEHLAAHAPSATPFMFEGRRLSAPGDIVRNIRASDTQRSRLSTNSRPSPLSRGSEMASSPAPQDDDAHISTREQHANVSHRRTPFRLVQTTENQSDGFSARGSGNHIQLKSRKSLHQRLDGGSSHADGGASDDGHGTIRHDVEKRRLPHTADTHGGLPSRSGSVVSSSCERGIQDEDFSSIMMRGAANLRNAKHDNEEQRREIIFLQSQLQNAKVEKEEVLQRLKDVKAHAKQSLEASSKSLNDVRSALDDLKAQSVDVFAFAAQTKISLPDVQELRATVEESVKAIEPLFDDDGHLLKAEETKTLVNDLQVECSKSRQVADLLRERLQSLGSELIDAKARITEMERAQAADREALRTLNDSLSNATSHIRELVEQLGIRRMEMQDAVVAGGELETKLSNAEEQILDLKESINAQDVEIAKKVSVERENAKLAALLGERESRLADLESVHDRLDSANMLSNEHCSRIRVLETQLANKHENIAVLEARIIQEQGSTQNIQLELRKLTQDLASSLAREESIGKELARITQEKIDIKQDLETAHSSLEESKRDLEARLNAVHQANTKCQVLEERIDSQMVSLRISKETITTLQDRLTESETKSARELEATTGKLNCQIAVLSEQKSALDGKLSDLEACVRAAQDSGMMAKAEYEDKLARQQEEYLKQLDLEQQRIGDAHNALEDARAMVKSLEEQVTASRQELSELRDELRDAKIPSPAHKEAIDALTSQITALREEKTELVLRARSIDSRYRTGDLNEEEKVFVNTLVLTSQSIHEQELVTKGNDLRRRDNTIKDLHCRIHLLETTLAKHLKSQHKAVIPSSNEKASLIDPGAWVPSSEKSSSPAHPVQGEDDRPSVNVDNTITAKSTPAPVREVTRLPLSTVPVSAANVVARPLPAARPHAGTTTARSTPIQMKKATVQFAPEKLNSSPLVYPSPRVPTTNRLNTHKTTGPAVHSSKPSFRRLDTDRSDEILDFEDPTVHASPLQDVPEGSKAKLGKRNRPVEVKSPHGGRHTKKLRTGVRTRSIAQQQVDADSSVNQSLEPLAANSRIRKRR